MTTRIANILVALALAASVAACTQTKPVEAETPTLNVTDWTDKTELYRDDTCTSTSPGWQFIEGSNQTKIRICKQECDVVQTDPKANVNVSLSCEPQRVPR